MYLRRERLRERKIEDYGSRSELERSFGLFEHAGKFIGTSAKNNSNQLVIVHGNFIDLEWYVLRYLINKRLLLIFIV